MGLIKTSLDDLTYRMNGLAMRAQSKLKTGHRERVYQRRLAELALGEGLQVETEKKVEVYINDSLVGFMFLDLWIEQMLIVECKAHNHQLT
ncbi:MAG TPA: GxxExxY protein, partial [Anaerolineales bacterium]|nr:GxxExxY protein [Anaerolineales bacterium]